MAEIDLEELKRMVAMRDGADDKWAVAADKALHASAPVLARRVLELAAERDAEIERTNLLANEIQALRDDAEKLAAEVERLGRVAASEREAREKCDRALRMKDEAMGELLSRLQTAGIDCSDLIP